jgi:hypothetical protein
LGRFSMTNWEAFSPCLPWPEEGRQRGAVAHVSAAAGAA